MLRRSFSWIFDKILHFETVPDIPDWSGCVIGIMGFSRILKFLLTNYRDVTMALLTGVMVGAMRKIWPWKEVLDTKIIRDKVHVLQEQNILPPQFDTQVIFAIILMLLGIIFVLSLEKFSRPSKTSWTSSAFLSPIHKSSAFCCFKIKITKNSDKNG